MLKNTILKIKADIKHLKIRPERKTQLQIGILAFAVLVRIVVLLVLRNQPLIGDPAKYFEVAMKITAGEHYYPGWPPGLPYYLAGWNLVFGPHEMIARISSLVLFLAFALVFRKLVTELLGTRAATIGLAIVAIYPVFIDHSIDVLTHLPSALCLIIALFCVHRLLLQRAMGYALLLGLSLGLMVLLRASSILLLAALPVFVGWRLRSLKFPAVALAIGLAVVGLWELRVQKLAGEFLFVNSYNNMNFYFGNNGSTPLYRTWWIGSHGALGLPDSAKFSATQDSVNRLTPHDQNIFYTEATKAHILAHPGAFLMRTINRFNAYFSFDSFTAAYAKNVGAPKIIILFILALDASMFLALLCMTVALFAFHGRQVLRDPMLLIITLSGILYSFPYWISFSHPVYHMGVLPVMILTSLYFLHYSPVGRWREQWGCAFSNRQKIAFGALLLYAIFMQAQFAMHMVDRL